MTIKDLYNAKKLSARSYYVCVNHGLFDLALIMDNYRKHNKFSNIRTFGKESRMELIALCKNVNENGLANFGSEYQLEQSLEIEHPLNNLNLAKIILSFSRIQREILNDFILVELNSLSVRSKNAISHLLNNNLKIRNFAQVILSKEQLNLYELENVGKTSVPELENYISTIKNFVVTIDEVDDENSMVLFKNEMLIKRFFSIDDVPKDVLKSESIFKLLDYLITKNVFYDEKKSIIFKNALKVYNHEEGDSLDDISLKVDLTRERVRQIREKIIYELFDKLVFLKNFDDDLLKKYEIDISSNSIEVNENIITSINENYEIKFSGEFITYILFCYLSDSFLLIGNLKDVLFYNFPKSSSRYNWKGFHLVKNRIAEVVDFSSLIEDVDRRINEKINESYSFNLKSYLSKFIKSDDIKILELALPVAEKIINNEFELFLDLDENLIFNRNTHKTIPEYIIEALESIGEESSALEIYKWIENKYPNLVISEGKVRVNTGKSDEIICFGRSSSYGLKKWELEREDVKGGTMKNIVIDLLGQYEHPLHIIDLLDEIHKYRGGTTEKNVLTNIKLDTYNSFIIFNQKFIGLLSKKNIYNSKKYEDLPVQLGKIILGLVKRKVVVNLDQLTVLLNEDYQLTPHESKNIITSLQLKI